ncbi:hypothetical protein ACFLUA_05315 [Chloroflexota bacterium]
MQEIAQVAEALARPIASPAQARQMLDLRAD